jgi:anthranilate phosphoribosyltransferase
MVKLGTVRTLVVSGDDGLGDVTLSGTTNVTEVADGHSRDFTWTPEDFGIARHTLDGLSIESPAESAALIRRILAGERGPARDIVVLNAAAGLVAFGKTNDPSIAANDVATAIDSGAAAALLARLAERSHQTA